MLERRLIEQSLNLHYVTMPKSSFNTLILKITKSRNVRRFKFFDKHKVAPIVLA